MRIPRDFDDGTRHSFDEESSSLESSSLLKKSLNKHSRKDGSFIEFKATMKVIVTLIITNVCRQEVLLSNETESAIGSKIEDKSQSKAFLAAYAQASLTIGVIVSSFICGILSATETLAPQAFGAKNYSEVGVVVVRGFIVGIGAILLLAPLLFNSDAIFQWFHQDDGVSILASNWVRIYTGSLPVALMYLSGVLFLQAQEVVLPTMLVSGVVALLIHPTNLYWLVDIRQSFYGSATAIVLTQTTACLVLFFYMKVYKPYFKETWRKLDFAFKKAFCWDDNMKLFLKLSIGGIATFFEWWFWSFHTLIAGSISVAALDIHSIPFQVMAIPNAISEAVGSATNIRVGAIIAKDVNRAKLIVFWVMVLSIVFNTSLSALIYLNYFPIVSAFTSNPEIIEGCHKIWHLVCYYVFFDGMAAISQGVLRSLALQVEAGKITSVCFWLVGVPMLTIRVITEDGGLQVLWSSLVPIYMIYFIMLSLCFMGADWNSISHNIRKREGVFMEEGDSVDSSTTSVPDEGSSKTSITVDDSIVSYSSDLMAWMAVACRIP